MPDPAPPAPPQTGSRARVVALLGNPNVGKTTLFNRLTGARQKTANFPGTTQEALVGRFPSGATLVDLPGVYALDLNLSESRVCREMLAGRLAPEGVEAGAPDALVVVIDATNLLRNLPLVAEAARCGLPTVAVVNMIDAARRRGIDADTARLEAALGCPVLAVSARTGENLDRLPGLLDAARTPAGDFPPPGADREAIEAWAERVYAAVAVAREPAEGSRTGDRLDRALTHPVLGVAVFAVVMTGLFWVIFSLAQYPMGWIETAFARISAGIEAALPAGAVRDLLAEGVVAGIGGTVVFLPQICLLFLLISLLESTGYLARAAFVADRLMRPFGLSGHSFVPLLSSHACALPGIMACRAIPDRRNRLATILAAPFMSCSARIPVYVLLTVILFPDRPLMQAAAFTGCYAVGAAAGLFTALLARRTVLRGPSKPMALELPDYRAPDLNHALRVTADRGWIFLRKAGTVILAISIVLWWLNAYPHAGPAPDSEPVRERAALVGQDDPDAAARLAAEADALDARHAASNSFLGRIGGAVQPVFEPLGYDRQLTIGVLASFAAREVFASTMAVQVAGTEDFEDEGVQAQIAGAVRDDGSPVFTPATSWSLLVFYVLAMQCLPTLVVTAREAGSWKWAAAQLGWMTGLAYLAAFCVHQAARAAGAA